MPFPMVFTLIPTRHFWGVRSILAELGYKNRWSTWKLLQKKGFPAYTRRGVGRQRGRSYWYTNSEMIQAFNLRRAIHERIQRLEPQAIEARRRKHSSHHK